MPVLDIKNPTLVRGHARLEGREDGRFRVRVGDYVIAADQVVVNTGTRSCPKNDRVVKEQLVTAVTAAEAGSLVCYLGAAAAGRPCSTIGPACMSEASALSRAE